VHLVGGNDFEWLSSLLSLTVSSVKAVLLSKKNLTVQWNRVRVVTMYTEASCAMGAQQVNTSIANASGEAQNTQSSKCALSGECALQDCQKSKFLL
jgi:hypothetical protein